MTDVEEIQYSEKYCDAKYEYRWESAKETKVFEISMKDLFDSSRHVIVPLVIGKMVPKTHLMTETEWRNLGIQQSPGKTR